MRIFIFILVMLLLFAACDNPAQTKIIYVPVDDPTVEPDDIRLIFTWVDVSANREWQFYSDGSLEYRNSTTFEILENWEYVADPDNELITITDPVTMDTTDYNYQIWYDHPGGNQVTWARSTMAAPTTWIECIRKDTM